MTSGDVLAEEPGQAELQDPNFLMYSYKVKPCQKKYRHDWRVCPFAHEGESAARRDPRKYKYVGVACPYAKQGKTCPRGQSCPCTHNVFEYWLHPTRFRTEICSQGTKCNRSCCFFAHTDSELRKLKHQDIINSAVGDPNETCSALESYLKKTNTCDLNDDNDSDSRDSGDDAVIIMGSVPKVEDDASSVEEEDGIVVGRVPESKGFVGAPDHPVQGYSRGDVFKMDRTSPAPLSQGLSRAYMSPELMMGRSPEGFAMDQNLAGRYQMSPQQDLPPYHPSIQDMYMASPEPGSLMTSDGQTRLVGGGGSHNQLQDQANGGFMAYSGSAVTSSPYGGHLSPSHQLAGLQQQRQHLNLSPKPPTPVLDSGLGSRMSEDSVAGVQSDYELLSRSWRINRGVSFPAVLNRQNEFGSSHNLQVNQGSHLLGSTGNQPTGRQSISDESALRSEFQKLSASWGLNKGATLPALHQTSLHQQDAPSLLQSEFEKLSGSWGINRGASNPAHLNLLSGLSGGQRGGLEKFSGLGEFQCEPNIESLSSLRCDTQIDGYQGQMSPLGGEYSNATIPSELNAMAASWGLGKNTSSLSDSFALGGRDIWSAPVASATGTTPSGPPPGFGAGRPSFDLPEDAPVHDLSFLGSDAMGSYVPSEKMVGRNWTFGGNGRVV